MNERRDLCAVDVSEWKSTIASLQQQLYTWTVRANAYRGAAESAEKAAATLTARLAEAEAALADQKEINKGAVRAAMDNANKLAAAEAERLTDALVVEQLQREIAAAEAARGIAEQQLTVICDGVNRRCGCDNNQLPLVSLDRLLAAHERDLAEAEARINRREFSVRLQSQRLYGQGFAAYLNGSATEGTAVIIADLHAILESCVDSEESWKRITAESCVHELLHAFQEILGREFNDDEVEAAIAAAKAAGGGE